MFIDVGRSNIIFESMKQFTKATSDVVNFELILGATSCLAMIVEADHKNEVSFLVDFLSNLRLESKLILFQMNSALDENLLSNKTVNFDIIISDTDAHLKGKDCSLKVSNLLCSSF